MRILAQTLVLVTALFGPSRARAECAPTAVPIGDETLVRSLAERLSASGISTTPADNCPAVHVTVEQRGEQLHLRVTDAYQRHGERDVRDLATAAAVVESWTLQEVDPGTVPETAPSVPPVAVTPAIAASPFSLSGAGRSSIGTDGSTWLGAAIHGCVRMGWSCLGATVALASDTNAVNDIATGSHRSLAIDAMATADVPWRLGAFTARPGLAAGYGWNRIEQQHLDGHAMPFDVSHANHSLRVGAQLAIVRPLAHSLAVFGELFADVATLRTAIPDGPRARAGVSLGLRIGAP